MTTYAQAKTLAETTLAAFIASNALRGTRTNPDANTTVATTRYAGPDGVGHECRVTLKGTARDIVVVRHTGPDANRNIEDKSFADLKAAAIKALTGKADKAVTLSRIRRATTVEDLLFSTATETQDAMEALRLRCEAHSDKRLQDFATSLGYDTIVSLVSYKGDPNPKFDAEADAGIAARSAEWTAAQSFMGAVLAGTIAPTFENYVAAMPATYAAPVY